MRFGGSSGFAAPIAWHSIIGLILALPPEVYDDVVHASIEAAFCELGLQAFRNEGGVNAIGSAGGSALPPAPALPPHRPPPDDTRVGASPSERLNAEDA